MLESVLKKEERISLALRALYRSYGYSPYRMSKFEPYDLYVANKDFLVGEGVITFMDTDGKLLALKPDVTLSIIKNTADDGLQKVYYDENVYRISGDSKQFKEIKQVGLECIGDVSAYEIYEAVMLAAASLAQISSSFVLDVSHLGVLSALLEEIGKGEACNAALLRCLSGRNAHELIAVCKRYGVEERYKDKLLTIAQAYGDVDGVLAAVADVCDGEKTKRAYDELRGMAALLRRSEYYSRMRLDFSIVNDTSYYNGIVFKGFVEGVCESVLSGGQYDRLMKRLGKRARAIGFAVYTDALERLYADERTADDGVTIVYDDETDTAALIDEAQRWREQGRRCCVRREVVGDVVSDMRGKKGGRV